MKAILAFSTALGALSPALLAQTLYDINFNTSDQGLNQVVLTRPGDPNYVSEIVFGAPEVVSSFGGLIDRPLRFDTINTPPGIIYDQVLLKMERQTSPILDVSFDFTSLGLIGSHNDFAIFFDTPSAQSVRFQPDGQITFHKPQGTLFADGETYHVRIHIDFTLNEWSVYRDGVMIDAMHIAPENYVRAIRFSYGLARVSPTAPDSSGVAIDNILVEVPEPGCLSLVVVGAGVWLTWFRQSKTGLAGQGDERLSR